jgi:hypothetical protein
VLIGLIVWFVRSPLFRARRGGRSQSGTHDNPYGGDGPGSVF